MWKYKKKWLLFSEKYKMIKNFTSLIFNQFSWFKRLLLWQFLAPLCKSNTNRILDYCSFIDCLPFTSWFYWILKYANDYEQLWPFQNSNDKLTSKFWFVNSIFFTLLHSGKITKKEFNDERNCQIGKQAAILLHT